MSKETAISYKANFKEEVDENGDIVSEARSYDGTIVYNFPESLDEARQMFGEAPALSLLNEELKLKIQALGRRNETQEQAQEAVNSYVPGVSTRGSGPTQKQVKEVLSKMSKEDVEKLLSDLSES